MVWPECFNAKPFRAYPLYGAGLTPASIPTTADLCRALTDDLRSQSGTTSTLWQGASASQPLT